jgi:hypothetical protein
VTTPSDQLKVTQRRCLSALRGALGKLENSKEK